jgi:ESCRT-I complex subunit TSG101
LAFVVPTKEMGVRKGREVEPGGRVTEEVVNEWWRTWEVRRVASPEPEPEPEPKPKPD